MREAGSLALLARALGLTRAIREDYIADLRDNYNIEHGEWAYKSSCLTEFGKEICIYYQSVLTQTASGL